MATQIFFGIIGSEAHALFLPSMYEESARSNQTWGNGTEVTGTWLSREISLGEWDTIKEVDQILVSATGSSVTTTAVYRNHDNTSTSIGVSTSSTLPQSEQDVPDIGTSPRLQRGLALQVTGQDLDIRGVDIVWRVKRLA